MIAVWIVVGLGLACCFISFLVTLIWRVKSTQIDDINIDVGGPRVLDPEQQRRIAEENKKKLLAMLAKVLTKKKFSQSKHKDK